MSLPAFHVVFISASILLALGLAFWCFPAQPVGVVGAVVVAFALVAYETWFLRKMRSLT